VLVREPVILDHSDSRQVRQEYGHNLPSNQLDALDTPRLREAYLAPACDMNAASL
jgi:hypothetical protein